MKDRIVTADLETGKENTSMSNLLPGAQTGIMPAVLADRLRLYSDQLSQLGPTGDLPVSQIDYFVARARSLGDDISRDEIVRAVKDWGNTRTRCCGFRADLPNGLCSTCIRESGIVRLQDRDFDGLRRYLWAVNNPTRAALARCLSQAIRSQMSSPLMTDLATALLHRV